MFPHVAVLPRHTFNTNQGDLRHTSAHITGRGAPEADDSSITAIAWRCDFIFHAAGQPSLREDGDNDSHPPRLKRAWRKEEALEAMIAFHGLNHEEDRVERSARH